MRTHRRSFGRALRCCSERALATGGAMDADSRGDTDTQGFTNPIHAEDEEGAQGEADGQQENEDRS